MKSEVIIKKIRDKLQTVDATNRTVAYIYQFNFTDDDGKLIKSMVFDFKALSVYEGTCGVADGEITISDDDFYLLGSKQITFDEVLAADKILLKGDKVAIDKMLEKFRWNMNK